MGRRPFPYTLTLRANGIWYYSISWTSGIPRRLCESRKSTGCETESAARRYVQKRIRELLSAPAPQALTLAQYAAPFYTDRCPHCLRVGRVSDETRENRRAVLERRILAAPIARVRLSDLQTSDLAEFRGSLLSSGMAGATAKRIMDILRTVLREARINRVIVHDPAQALPRLEQIHAEPGVFTMEELHSLFADRPGVWSTEETWCVYRLAAVLGLRGGEVRALSAGDVRGSICSVTKAWKLDRRVGLPKWGICRDIPVPAFLQRELARYETLPPDSFVSGRHKSSTWYTQRFAEALEKSGISSIDARGRKRTPHSLRHTAMTLLVAQGVSSVLIGAFLGHETGLTQTQKRYLHMMPGDMQAVTEALERVWAP